MKILFVIDRIELKYFEFNDLVTNFWFIKEFLKRDYKVSIATKQNLFIENAKGCVWAKKSFLKDENIFYEKNEEKYLINDFDIVFFQDFFSLIGIFGNIKAVAAAVGDISFGISLYFTADTRIV